ncbi:hypothetical protein SEPCBS57363_003127 [Sporothrix epigloea]|uniref:Uncharacterized protein n=1 Tax=Sporothrix epigloea TaxID=1892477 RepID=A0ABP0DJR4_9PEZI
MTGVHRPPNGKDREELELCQLLGIPSAPILTPVALLPEGEGVFQTAEQLQHILDLTFLPKVVELDVLPDKGYGWPREKPKPLTI